MVATELKQLRPSIVIMNFIPVNDDVMSLVSSIEENWKIDNVIAANFAWQYKSDTIGNGWPHMVISVQGKEVQLFVTHESRQTSTSSQDAYRTVLLKNYRVEEWIDLHFDILFSHTEGEGLVEPYIRYAPEPSYRSISPYHGRNMFWDSPGRLSWGNDSSTYPSTRYPQFDRNNYHDDISIVKLE